MHSFIDPDPEMPWLAQRMAPIFNEAIRRYGGEDYSKINLPLLNATPRDLVDQEFKSIIGGSKAMLIQVFPFGSHDYVIFIDSWKRIELPQLRSANSMELGCDAKGFSRAGNFAETWYCAIVAGRRGLALNKMREAMRKIQKILINDFGADGDKILVKGPPVTTAAKEKQLTFAWLDGGAQKVYCLFYLHKLENIYEACGPSEYNSNNRPRLFVVPYKRNSSEDEARAKRKNNIWNAFDGEDSNLASQIVAIYNARWIFKRSFSGYHG